MVSPSEIEKMQEMKTRLLESIHAVQDEIDTVYFDPEKQDQLRRAQYLFRLLTTIYHGKDWVMVVHG